MATKKTAKTEIDFDAEVKRLSNALDEWDLDVYPNPYTFLRHELRKVKTTPEIRLAIYLKMEYGPKFSGETNEGWIQSAKEYKKILGGK